MPVVSTSPSSLVKVVDALHSLSKNKALGVDGVINNNKAFGVDGVMAKLLRFGWLDALKWLHSLIIAMWESRVAPSQWKRVRIMPLHKGGQHIMANYHGINMLDVCGKVYIVVLRECM